MASEVDKAKEWKAPESVDDSVLDHAYRKYQEACDTFDQLDMKAAVLLAAGVLALVGLGLYEPANATSRLLWCLGAVPLVVAMADAAHAARPSTKGSLTKIPVHASCNPLARKRELIEDLHVAFTRTREANEKKADCVCRATNSLWAWIAWAGVNLLVDGIIRYSGR